MASVKTFIEEDHRHTSSTNGFWQRKKSCHIYTLSTRVRVRREENAFLNKIITCDPETKQESSRWVDSATPRPVKAKVNRSAGEVQIARLPLQRPTGTATGIAQDYRWFQRDLVPESVLCLDSQTSEMYTVSEWLYWKVVVNPMTFALAVVVRRRHDVDFVLLYMYLLFLSYIDIIILYLLWYCCDFFRFWLWDIGLYHIKTLNECASDSTHFTQP